MLQQMKKIILIHILILTGFNLFSQTGFTNYPVVPSTTNLRTSIAIDGSGNKWYGTTSKGAYKFDGTSWTIYDVTSSGIPSNIVNDVTFDASGNGWFATIEGLVKFDGTT